MTPAIAAAFRLVSVLLLLPLSAVALDDVSVRSFLGPTFSGCIGAALTGTSTSIGAAASSARCVVPAMSSSDGTTTGGTLVAGDAPAHRPDFFRLLLDHPAAAISGFVQPSATCASDHEVGPEQPRGGGNVNPVAFRPSADVCHETEAADQCCCIEAVLVDEAGADCTCAPLEATDVGGSTGGGGERPSVPLRTVLARLVSHLPGRGIIRSIFEAVVGQDLPSTFETNVYIC